jgi:hypothetical protein
VEDRFVNFLQKEEYIFDHIHFTLGNPTSGLVCFA